jgi:hypothetical protein
MRKTGYSFGMSFTLCVVLIMRTCEGFFQSSHFFERLSNPTPRSMELHATSFFDKVKQMQKAFDDEVWDLFQGAKERKWSPDRRPEANKGERAGPSPDTVLSWGGAQSIEIYERMVEQMEDDMEGVNPQTPLGSAAVTLYGEGSKLDSEQMEEELDAFRDQQAPALGSDSRNIADAVELAELVRAKYGKVRGRKKSNRFAIIIKTKGALPPPSLPRSITM